MAVGALSAGQAQAQAVNVPGYGYWDVTTFLGSYYDNTLQFALPANGGVMPWWGSQTAAEAFANAVRNQLPPSPNCETCQPPTARGPFFATELMSPVSQFNIVFLNIPPQILI